MLKNVLAALVILACSLSFVFAETVKGKITKIDGTKITVETGKDKASKEFDATGCKVCKMDKKNKVEVPGGLKAEGLEVGKAVTLEVDGGKVTEIILGGGKKK